MAKNKQSESFDNSLSYRDNLAQGYVPNHRKGSRKARIHERYIAKGDKAALALSRKLGCKDSSYKAWSADWRIQHPEIEPMSMDEYKKAFAKAPTKRAAKGKARKQ